MGNWSEKLLDLIYPRITRCVSCLCDLDDGYICSECFDSIRHNTSSEFNLIRDVKVYNACYYFGSMKNIVYNFKVNKDFSSGKYLSDILVNYIRRLNIKIDYLTYVPRDNKKIKVEGFDQSRYLAKSVSCNLGLPYIEVLYCKGKNKDQKNLDLYERGKNIKNKFFIHSNISSDDLSNKHGLIIDDIATTYNTVLEVCEVIKRTNPKTHISVLTIAKTLI